MAGRRGPGQSRRRAARPRPRPGGAAGAGRCGQGIPRAGDRMFAAKCQGYLAQAYQQLGELLEALAVLRRARQTLAELGARSRRPGSSWPWPRPTWRPGPWPEARSEAAEAASAPGRRHGARCGRGQLPAGAAELGAEMRTRQVRRWPSGRAFDQVGDRQYAARTRQLQAEGRPAVAARIEAGAGRAGGHRAGGRRLAGAAGLARFRLADLAATRAGRSRAGVGRGAGRAARSAPAPLPLLVRQARLAPATVGSIRRSGCSAGRSRSWTGRPGAARPRAADGVPGRPAGRIRRAGGGGARPGRTRGRRPGLAGRWRGQGRNPAGAGRRVGRRRPVAGRPGSELADAYADLGATYQALQDAEARRADAHGAAGRAAWNSRSARSGCGKRSAGRRRPGGPGRIVGTAAPARRARVPRRGNDLVVFRSGAAPISGPGTGGCPSVATSGPAGRPVDPVHAGQRVQRPASRTAAPHHPEVLAGLYDLMLAPVLDRRPEAPERMRIVPHQLPARSRSPRCTTDSAIWSSGAPGHRPRVPALAVVHGRPARPVPRAGGGVSDESRPGGAAEAAWSRTCCRGRAG